ncbi:MULTISPECIES: D-2-hydroxyacid dehydrogenase [unclassified Enterococcus]|uniref:D-2-hydroxyacid dehydrogenase n=1 Tax=unclassified Enterococcus TaxID=2608891 RepID=UPI0015553D96|nr:MULTISPECIES: D-2-hydroxyacid dehydrogenase [unclassified Enterococcus]MBS7576446.1 D-2-hydroxyacid dehydrogenase [Enterococcus sp. MMGLQ5-2]MBS7583678.1 D-2-hydroxyacid dehydrogenase [Enterococcus sp. MMGLQ5-1]NPD11539.1 D-2-hydroxyacid dehydrogenase [Enterococcus sp. MMGLQ5-1]NPD36283.1 D-2-hydroxyacid dehydrogenase [Enterococcus sp. MMGLQ5-2]
MIGTMNKIPEKLMSKYSEILKEEIVAIDAIQASNQVFSDIDILIGGFELTEKAIKNFPNLKLIFTFSSGVNFLPFDYLKQRKIKVVNSRGLHAEQMSEHAIGLMLSLTRGLKQAAIAQGQKKWLSEASYPFSSVNGKEICIVGAGTIGQAVARKAKAFDMRVTGVKRKLERLENFDNVYPISELTAAVASADFIILLTPLTEATRHLFNQAIFGNMKASSYFINLSRGGTVDESALHKALIQGQIAGAALDVFEQEPLNSDSPFWELDNVIITPHTAGVISNYAERALSIFSDNLQLYRAEKKMTNQVNLDLQY